MKTGEGDNVMELVGTLGAPVGMDSQSLKEAIGGLGSIQRRFWRSAWGMHYFAQTEMTKCCRLSGLDTRHFTQSAS